MFHSSTQPQAVMPLDASASVLNVLIRRSIELRRMYRHAATASEPGLRMVLNENAQTLDLLIADLQTQVHGSGDRACRHGAWRAAVHRHLVGWSLHAAGHRDSAWIRALARREGALLQVFERAIDAAPAELALSLRRQLPRLRSIHLDMHSLAGTAGY
ncbi:DUF2383 domain-containing protein [Rhodanobacter sp. Col0626]|uniref:DUF2383 domain-containing protein n=1 Tax=Rhodanobacter sp. Col0626 TaxID=3415679 RepID=UPI003CEC07C6